MSSGRKLLLATDWSDIKRRFVSALRMPSSTTITTAMHDYVVRPIGHGGHEQDDPRTGCAHASENVEVALSVPMSMMRQHRVPDAIPSSGVTTVVDTAFCSSRSSATQCSSDMRGAMTQSLQFEVHGQGQPVVLLHGAASTGMGSWGAQLDELARHHTVLLPNLPGSGESPLPDGALRLEAIADQVVDTITKAGHAEFAVAGASLGAAVAISIAARHPKRIRALIPVVGYAYPRTTLRLNLETWMALYARPDESLGCYLTALSFSERYLSDLPYAALQQAIRQFSASPTPGTAAQIALTLNVDLRRDLKDVEAPTLVVAADGDRFVAPEHSIDLAKEIPGAQFTSIAGGHAVMFEDPQSVTSAVLNFLAGIG